MNDGTWAMYTIGVLALSLGVVFAITALQTRRTLVDISARRLGHVAGGMIGLGVALIVLRATADRLEASSMVVQVAAFAAVGALAITLAHLGAEATAGLARRSQPTRERVAPIMEIEPGQRLVWSSSLSSRWILLPAIGLLTFGPLVMLAPDTPPWLLVVIVIGGIALLSLASIRVRADSAGLHVKYGALPWPTTNISIDRIDEASVIDVRPMDWGGWGYRGTLTLMKQAAIVLRAGPGIRLDLNDGRVFVVTVDDPETAVALINAHARQAVT